MYLRILMHLNGCLEGTLYYLKNAKGFFFSQGQSAAAALREVRRRSHLPSPVGYKLIAGPPSQNVHAGYVMSKYSAVYSRRKTFFFVT